MSIDDIIDFIKKHSRQFVYGLIGLISAILMLTIGFFPTLLIALFVAGGIMLACAVDKVGFRGIVEIIKRLFGRK